MHRRSPARRSAVREAIRLGERGPAASSGSPITLTIRGKSGVPWPGRSVCVTSTTGTMRRQRRMGAAEPQYKTVPSPRHKCPLMVGTPSVRRLCPITGSLSQGDRAIIAGSATCRIDTSPVVLIIHLVADAGALASCPAGRGRRAAVDVSAGRGATKRRSLTGGFSAEIGHSTIR